MGFAFIRAFSERLNSDHFKYKEFGGSGATIDFLNIIRRKA